MTQYETPGPEGSSERWNVNMPAVIGVVFVFLVAVIVWVIASGDDDPEATPAPVTSATTEPDSTVDSTVAPTTTATPDTSTTIVPETTAPETTLATTTVPETTEPGPTTTVPVTTAPGAEPGAVPGDLGIPGRPMQRPQCDGGYITILASAVGDQATADGVAAVLDAFPGSEYLRTDQTCSSLRPDVDGQPVYVVYFGPFAFPIDACTARADGPEDAYVKQLSNDVPPDQVIACE